MTYTVIGHCPRERAVGIGIISSPLDVAARCAFVRGGVGAVSTQAFTNPVLGPLALHMLQTGVPPEETLRRALATDRHPDKRQLGIVTLDGRIAAHTGPNGPDHCSHLIGEGCVAMGNNLVGRAVVEAIAESFAAGADLQLEERLMRALEAAREAGGERGGHLSGGLLAVDAREQPRTDLRIDMAEVGDSVDSLRRLLDAFKPMIGYYRDWHENPGWPGWREYYKAETGREGPRAERMPAS